MKPFIPAAIIFDFDGVLVDSLALHLKAWESAFVSVFNQPYEPAWSKEIIGHSTQWIAGFLCDKINTTEQNASLIQCKNQFLRSGSHKAPWLPGSQELMNRLANLQIPFGIASNAPRGFIDETLKHHGLDGIIFFGREDYQSPKPSPEPFFKAAKALGIGISTHDKVVVFEDSTHGLEAAIAAGMVAFGVATQHPPEYLLTHGAHAVCLNLKDDVLLQWVPNL